MSREQIVVLSPTEVPVNVGIPSKPFLVADSPTAYFRLKGA